MSKIILLTRPQNESEMTAGDLRAHGVESVIEPLSAIVPVNVYIPVSDAPIIITSRHALTEALAAKFSKDVPVFTVGKATTEQAKAYGFSKVYCADGNAKNLAELINATLQNPSSVVYLRGRDVTHELQALLPTHTVHEYVVYEAKLIDSLSAATLELLKTNALEGVAFFSSRHARHFITLCEKANFTPFPTLTCYCFSKPIATSVAHVAWGDVKISTSQTHEAMLQIMVHDRPRNSAA